MISALPDVGGQAAGYAFASIRQLIVFLLGMRYFIQGLMYTALRERIVFGELSPGERLVEADLAARFQISKTPVREALLTLEAEGLVTMRAHRGATVSELSPQQYRDVQFTRDALEFGAAPRSSRR